VIPDQDWRESTLVVLQQRATSVAKRGVTGAKTLLNNLARFFPRNRRAVAPAVAPAA